jgi:hypothetical protein
MSSFLSSHPQFDRGGWTFPPPLGYLKAVGANGEKTIIADPKRSHLIAQAFQMYATGLHTKQDVLDAVTRLGLTTKNGNRVSPQTFSQPLRKTIYAGILDVPKWGVRQKSCRFRKF